VIYLSRSRLATSYQIEYEKYPSYLGRATELDAIT
jgi:hypothetical protein